jgi:hypothetical protein
MRIASRTLTVTALALALVLGAPWAAMQISGEVQWTARDFVLAAALVLGTGVAFDLVVRRRANRSYRLAAALALGAAFLLVWANGAVGLIGSEGEPANRLYALVLVVAGGGALLARFGAGRLALVMAATAAAQTLICAYAMLAGLDEPVRLAVANGLFVGLWAAAAWLFRDAERASTAAGRAAQGSR